MAFLSGAPATATAAKRALASERPHSDYSEASAVKVLGARFGVPVDGSTDERMATIAERQRGLLSRGQLLAAGIPSSTISRLITKQRLLSRHRGVYGLGHLAPAPLQAETAALLSVRDGAALSHHSAAVLWGIAKRGSDRLIHVTVCATAGGAPLGVRVHRSNLMARRDVRVRKGIPVLSPARVLLDLSAELESRERERALDEALILGLARPGELQELLARCKGHPGRGAFRVLVEQHTTTTFTRSEAEECFLALVREAQLPRPLVNVRRHGYEIDFLWPDQNLAVEVDGYTYHRSRGAFEHDRSKDADLHIAGIKTIRVTWRQLQDEPIAVITRVARAFGAAPR